MKKILYILFATSLMLNAQTTEEPTISAVDGYAARVNNRIITYGDIRENVIPFIRQAEQYYQGPDLAQQIKKAYLDGREALIEEALIQEEARTLGLSLPSQAVEEEVKNLIEVRFKGDRAALSKALSARRITYEEWREELADQLVMRVYYSQEVLQRVHVSDQDVRNEYEATKDDFKIPFRVKYRYILINKGNTDEEKTVKRQQAENILQKLGEGTPFLALAEEVSEGDTSLSAWRDLNDVRPELRPSLIETPVGSVSELIENDTVYYILKIEARQQAGFVAYEERSEKIRTELLTKERERLHDQLMERLSAKHYIKRY